MGAIAEGLVDEIVPQPSEIGQGLWAPDEPVLAEVLGSVAEENFAGARSQHR